MEMQAEAERRKRAQILESEGERQSNINTADGKRSAMILESEGAKVDQINRALGEAEAIQTLTAPIGSPGGTEARVAEHYLTTSENLARSQRRVEPCSSSATRVIQPACWPQHSRCTFPDSACRHE